MHSPRDFPSADSEVLRYWNSWSSLFQQVRDFEPDVLVLVARKMPRIFDLLTPPFPKEVLCISDQAIPFCRSELEGARVAVLDDIWNVGSTMLKARDRVEAAAPSRVQLFALAAKHVEEALRQGVRLAVRDRISDGSRRAFAEYSAKSLCLVPKPFDADFPILEQTLRDPFSTWNQCWTWLRLRFGDEAYSLTDSTMEANSFARATIRLPEVNGATVKARLYFDFRTGTCNVVPMLLRGRLELRNIYVPGSLPHRAFDELEHAAQWAPKDAVRDALARSQVFCDAVAAAPHVQEALKDLLTPTTDPFSFDEIKLQFGRELEAKLRSVASEAFAPALLPGVDSNETTERDDALLSNERLMLAAEAHARERLPLHALATLLDALSELVGADDPASYELDEDVDRIQAEPYQRLRIGFSFRGLAEFFARSAKGASGNHPRPSALVSELLDILIDNGAVVPTFTTIGACSRIYRKGECDPRVDEMANRVEYALEGLRITMAETSRTRVAKLLAIMAYAGTEHLSVQAMERGVVATVPHSVVERQDAELTRALAVRGRSLWA